MTLVVVGNPADGFTYYGPFADYDTALRWAENQRLGGDWWLIPITDPLKVDDPESK